MIKRVIRRGMREPLPCIATVLLSAVLAVILCFLHQSQKEEQQNFENTYDATPITFEITWLNGNRLNNSAAASGHMADILPELFLGTSRHEPEFDDLITDLKIRMSYTGSLWLVSEEDGELDLAGENQKIVGITSSKIAKETYPDFGQTILWYEGYDESVFKSELFVCVAPSSFEGVGEVVMTFSSGREAYSCTLKIAGVYPGDESFALYCPYAVMERIYAGVNEPKVVEHLSGRLADNDDLERFRERASKWFAAPNPLGEPTPWENNMGYETYPLAIDINDSLLRDLGSDLRNSITVNRIAAALVFLLSAGAGFLTGFLVIRARKREIALMRTLGTSNVTVFLELETEQILCVGAGVLIGGSYSLYGPVAQLCIFAGMYITGLAVALLVFLNSNLLATVKEDE